MMKAFILCAGNQDRWNGPGFKQMVIIQGERLLDRTIRQLRDMGVDPYVAAHCEHLNRQGSTWVRIRNTRCTLDTVRQTMDLWTESPVLILCGDVYWTNEAIGLLQRVQRPKMTFYTDTYDIFGIRINDLEVARTHIESIQPQSILHDPHGRTGRLGRLYRELAGKTDEECDYGSEIGPVNGQYAEYVLDGTTDFDSYEWYLAFRQCVEQNPTCQ